MTQAVAWSIWNKRLNDRMTLEGVRIGKTTLNGRLSIAINAVLPSAANP